MPNEIRIRIAGNTQTPCIEAIKAKGFKITLSTIYTKDDDYQFCYDAEKEGLFFSATSPEELLGLIAMWELRGNDWRATKEEHKEVIEFLSNSPLYDEDGNEIDEKI